MKRLTYEEPSGIWGVHSEEIADMSHTMYAVAERLLEYEETGLIPDDIRTMQAELTVQKELEQVHIGQVIAGYRIIGMFNGYCIAQSEEFSDNYVVWTIDDDGCGVHGGRYRSAREEAVKAFKEYACHEPELEEIPPEVKETLQNIADKLLSAIHRLEDETSPGFVHWLISLGYLFRDDADIETLRDIYEAIDDEDK